MTLHTVTMANPNGIAGMQAIVPLVPACEGATAAAQAIPGELVSMASKDSRRRPPPVPH